MKTFVEIKTLLKISRFLSRRYHELLPRTYAGMHLKAIFGLPFPQSCIIFNLDIHGIFDKFRSFHECFHLTFFLGF